MGAIPKDLKVIAFYRCLQRVFCSSMLASRSPLSSALPLSAFLPDVVLLLSAANQLEIRKLVLRSTVFRKEENHVLQLFSVH